MFTTGQIMSRLLAVKWNYNLQLLEDIHHDPIFQRKMLGDKYGNYFLAGANIALGFRSFLNADEEYRFQCQTAL